MAKWYLESIDVAGGFLGGLSLKLPPRLTCVIGPRGSGKSTLAEAIRCTLTGTTGIAKPRLDLARANLGASVVSLSTCTDDGRNRYAVRRILGQPAAITGSDGRALSAIDLDRGTFLPLDAYTSSEIEAIADESLGERRRQLLDDLRPGELRAILARASDLRRALEANGDAIASAERTVHDLGEQIEEMGDARARLASLPPLEKDTTTAQLMSAARQKQHNGRELTSIAEANATIDQLEGALLGLVEDVKRGLPSLTLSDSANAALTASADAAVRSMEEVLRGSLENALGQLDAMRHEIADVKAALRVAHEPQEQHYLTLHQQSQHAAAVVKDRAAAEQGVASLEHIEAAHAKARADSARLREERKALRAQYLLERDQISDLRQSVADALGTEVGRNIRVRVLRNADSLNYRETLLRALKGARVKNHEDILDALLRLRPEQLAQIVTEDDAVELERQTSLGSERCKRILESFRSALNPFALEVAPIDDRISIELNVASADAPLFRDASELSRGQKCTAMLPLLLARRDTPLMIDQPEDNLDNHFVYETVVESIRRLKPWRQMIFITHNANIPVLGEADLVVVLNSDGKRGFVEKAGTFEDCRDEIIDLLEGGREAFEMRSRRYGSR